MAMTRVVKDQYLGYLLKPSFPSLLAASKGRPGHQRTSSKEEAEHCGQPWLDADVIGSRSTDGV